MAVETAAKAAITMATAATLASMLRVIVTVLDRLVLPPKMGGALLPAAAAAGVGDREAAPAAAAAVLSGGLRAGHGGHGPKKEERGREKDGVPAKGLVAVVVGGKEGEPVGLRLLIRALVGKRAVGKDVVGTAVVVVERAGAGGGAADPCLRFLAAMGGPARGKAKAETTGGAGVVHLALLMSRFSLCFSVLDCSSLDLS